MTRRILLVGGLDPSGGAGITLDAIVAAGHGGAPLPLALALTEQGLRGFRRCHVVAAAQWRGALAAVLADGPVHAIKVGLVPDVATARALAEELAPLARTAPLVVDPVLSATAGGYDTAADLTAALREHLVPLAALVTPNQPEFEALFGGDAAGALACGAGAVLHKGGHGDGPTCDDVLVSAAGAHTYRRQRLPCGRVRGTGCALATSIAVRLAYGVDLASACGAAGHWLAAQLRALGAAPADGLTRTLPFERLAPAP